MAAMSALPDPRDQAQGPRLHVQLERHSDSRHPAVPDSHTYWSIASSPSLRSRDAGDLDRPLKLERSLTPIAGQNCGFNSARILGSNPSSMLLPEQHVQVEHYSDSDFDSAGGYITLDESKPQDFNTLVCAVKAKLRVRFMATVTLVNMPAELTAEGNHLEIKPAQHVQLERCAGSTGGYIALDKSNLQVSKTTTRAAKAKLKLRVKTTVTPVHIPARPKDKKDISSG
ncbi:unnamed protein product [Zymoseptoria tritici ST99CH_3D1]|nr:unnamed protein product [Zymoseptoria tritici ST99CH_3D1]